MIDFKQLVESLILEGPSGKDLAYYWDTNTELTNLRTFFDNTFDLPTDWPTALNVFAGLHAAYSRPAYVSMYADYVAFLPALDFACYVADKHTEKQKVIDVPKNINVSGQISKLVNDFIAACTAANPIPAGGVKLNPVCQYVPVSTTIVRDKLTIRKKAGCQPGAFAALALKNFESKGYTLLQAVAHIADIRQSPRTIISRTAILPVVDNDIKNVFTKSNMFAAGAPGGKFSPSTVLASRNPKQMPKRLSSINAGHVMELSALINQYAIENRPPVTPPNPNPPPATEKEILVVLNTKVKDIKDKNTNTSKAIIKWITDESDTEPGKKDYAGLQSGAAKLASAASGGVQFGK